MNIPKKRKKAYLLVLMLVICFSFYFFSRRLDVHHEKDMYLYIPTHATYTDVLDSLSFYQVLPKAGLFKIGAKLFDYPGRVRPGKYRIGKGMHELRLLNNLLKGRQEGVQLLIKKARDKYTFASRIEAKLELNGRSLSDLLNDSIFLIKYKMNTENVMCLFIPNTYTFWWNTSSEKFLDRMYVEYKRFWNTTRVEQATRMNLSPIEIIILASIVEEETNKNDEKPLVASVYLNRLRKGMKLQADPTVRFASGNFEMKRVLSPSDLTHPYNTYHVYGLPPGPICIPSISSIEAVLKNEQTSYLYFCAKEDFSGYHRFERTYEEHLENALKWRRALDQNHIYR